MGGVAALPRPSIAMATRPQLVHGVQGQFWMAEGLEQALVFKRQVA